MTTDTQIDLNLYQCRVLSQWGQDGVLHKIFETIGTTNKYFVEFGSSGNDSGMGNTAQLRRIGFDGLLMDGWKRPFNNDVLDKIYDVKIEFIKASNINELFKKYTVPHEFDFLSIDIDGQDFHVWNALDTQYKPRVVSIEINHHILPGVDKVMHIDEEYTWKGTQWFGSSVTAVKRLGIKKGYTLVATCMSDAIFVRNDLIYNKEKNDFYFKNMNNEHELVRLNTDIYTENLKAWFMSDKNHFDTPFFASSEDFL
jgi:hypothetical protein